MDISILERCRVLPVVTPLDETSTVELARALQAGGMGAIEITLRSEAALPAMARVKAECPGMLIAAGTVTSGRQIDLSLDAGADFIVSPGATPELLCAASERGVDFLPGVASASDLMQAMEFGFVSCKLFPAVAAGGIALLKSLGGPFPNARFCPTGGLTPDNFREFLALPNVVCCGGSWMVTEQLISEGNWIEIERLARQAMA